MDIWFNIGDIFLRSLLSIVFLFFITRFMGRKQISQLTFFDYIIGISIGSIAAAMATTQEIEYIDGFIAMAVYSGIAVIISLLTNKSMWFRRFINGKTYLLIENGVILNKNLGKVKYDVNDLLSEARFAGYFNISDIAYAVMEPSGRISFMPHGTKENVVCEDINLQKPDGVLLANVVIDGKIMHENLKMAGLDEVWLNNEIKKQGYNDIKEIILATVTPDDNHELSIYERSDKLVSRTFID